MQYTITYKCLRKNILQIKVACEGIEPQFLKHELCPLMHKLLTKNKPPKTKSPRKFQKLSATWSTIYVLGAMWDP